MVHVLAILRILLHCVFRAVAFNRCTRRERGFVIVQGKLAHF
jgi:hypothetical protein